LTEIFNTLGFTNVNETTVETFPAGTYNITLYAEFAGYCDENELSYYKVDTSDFGVIFTGPEGGSGYLVSPVNKSFTTDYEFGLSMLSPDGQGGTYRYYTETSRNGDGLKHFNVCRNLDDPAMFLLGFENQYGGGDKDYNDMVFSLKPYAPTEYTLAVTVVGGGSVSKSPDLGTYSYGTVVTLTATADPGWTFSVWSGDASGSNPVTTVNMTSNKAVTATFTQEVTYTLTITITTGGTANPPPGAHVYPSGTNVPITAIPYTGYQFNHWELDSVDVGSANPYTVTMNDDHTLDAVFEEAPSPPPAVGGFALPITLDLGTSNSLIPQIGLASALSATVTATIMLVRRRKKTLKRAH
jgi:uncharacterized repeat protein (TIGR02543 family)